MLVKTGAYLAKVSPTPTAVAALQQSVLCPLSATVINLK